MIADRRRFARAAELAVLAVLAVLTALSVLAVLPVLVGSAAAAQTPQAQIDGIEIADGHARFVLTTADLPSADPLTAADVVVQVDGTPVAVTVTPAEATGTPVPPRAVMVVLDASGSMGDSGIATARQAAQSFVAGLPADVQVGLVTFATTPTLELAPTADRARFEAALGSVRSGGNTALYDAVGTAVSALEAAGFGPTSLRRLIVLSDGDDTTSSTELSAAANLLAAGGVPVDVIAFKFGGVDGAALQRLADAAGGRVLSAQDAAQLSAVFTAIARTFTQRTVVEFDVPPALTGTSAQLRVAVNTGAGTINTEVPMDLAGAGSASDPVDPIDSVAGDPVPAQPSWRLPVLLGMIFGALLLVLLAIVGGAGRGAVGRRLNIQFRRYGPSRYTDLPRKRALSAAGWLDQLLGTGPRAVRVAAQLELAGLKIKVSHWRLLRLVVSLVLAAGLTVFFGAVLLGAPIGVLAGWFGTRFYLSICLKRRFAAFAEQLPDVLQMLAGSLQSGFSLAQAFNAVVREGNQPAAEEFGRALAETRIGIELENALDRTAVRMQSADLRWVVMAVRIQREVGGNLAEVLLTTIETMRERAKTRRQVRALSAEGKLSAYILIGLPIGLGGFLFMTRPDYMAPLYSTPLGILMLTSAVVMVTVGSLWMRQLIKVEV